MSHSSAWSRSWEIDVGRETITWSPQTARLIGFETPPAGIPLPLFYTAVHSADRRRLMRSVARGIERGGMQLTFRVVRPRGTMCRVVAHGIMLTEATTHSATRMIGWFDTRTGRRRVDPSVRTSAHRMALAAIAADVGFWRLDLVTQRRWISPFAAGIFGIDAHERLTNDAFYAAVHPNDRERVRAARARVIADRSQFDETFRIIRRDGATRWVHSIAVVLRDPRSGHDQLVGVVADVTTRFLAQQELLDQRRQLAHLARVAVVGELSGAVTHELSQPLTVILNTARAAQYVLERGGQIDRAVLQEVLGDIADASKRAGTVMDRIRGLIRNEPLTTEVISLDELVTEVVAIMRNELLAREVAAQVDIGASLPPVRGDRVQLQQVLVNLILNACEAMAVRAPADRRLAISASAHDGGCSLAISDSGPGISLTPTDRIFEPFVTSKVNGAGLGLAICQMVVTAHGGRLWAENNPGGGAAFHLVLPRAASRQNRSPDIVGAAAPEPHYR
jgi:PAS domain S-box-containing protein